MLQAATSRATVSTEGEFASQFVTVNGVDLPGLVVRLSAGSTIEGRLTFEGGEPPDDPDFHLSAVPMDPDLASFADNAPARADIHDDWTFDMSGINGPRRLQLTQAPEGWTLKTVRVNGVDVTDTPLMFGTAGAVAARRRSRADQPRRHADGFGGHRRGRRRADFRVIAFSTDRTRRYAGSRFVVVSGPGRDGTSLCAGCRPATTTSPRPSSACWTRRRRLTRGSFWSRSWRARRRITLTEGERRSVSVKVIR